MNHDALTRLISENRSLCEGGAVGHLSHLYDNHELTFAEIKEVLASAADGRLERVSEKIDGMNLVFTYDVSSGELKVARSGGDIKGGGMGSAELAKKFFGRGNVELAFNSAFTVLEQALSGLSDRDKATVFGERATRWYSMEIIYAPDPNTVSYDSNNIVFHGWPVFQTNPDGSVEHADDDSGVDLLSRSIDRMQRSVKSRDWRVRGPALLNMKALADGTVLAKAISEINAAMSAARVSDGDTVFDYLRSLMGQEVADLGLPRDGALATVERAIGAPGAPTVNDIKKMIPKELQRSMQDFVKASPAMLDSQIAPIEGAIHRFAIEVLRGLESTLIANNDAEVSRLRGQVSKAISAIKASGHSGAMEVLKSEMQRLGSVENVAAAMEGIVFFYKGQAYKFTGAFAPAHQILSLFKYGRKGIPKMDLGESSIHLIREGGHAFEGVGPIELEDFRDTWPAIQTDLRALGCTKIVPIGSTGKKLLMGDVDLAAEYPGSRDEFFDSASDVFGRDSVAKVGSNIVTVRYPVKGHRDQFVQVDVMLGDPKYLAWSRYGTSPVKGHPDYSPVKGVVRNVLLNTINRFAAAKVFPGQQTNTDRVRYSVDFDSGLFKTTQTRRPSKPGAPPLKAWKTVSREMVSDDPDEIVQVIFGRGWTAHDLRSFEDVVEALKSSPELSGQASEILRTFAEEMRELVKTTPHMLGDDPEAALKYIDRVAQGRYIST